MLHWRLLLGGMISAIIVGLCALDVFLEHLCQIPGLALFPLLVLLSMLACREMLHFANRNHVYPVPYITYLGSFLILLSGWATFAFQHSQPPETELPPPTPVMSAPGTPVDMPSVRPDPKTLHLWEQLKTMTPGNWALSAFALVTILVFLQEMYSFVRPGAVNIRMAYTIFTMVYVGLFATFLTLLRLCFGLFSLIAFVAIVKSGDIGAYTVGRLFGRNKMAPGLSPGKTIEGAFGAILFSCVAACLCYAVLQPWIFHQPIPRPFSGWWVVYGIMLGFIGMLGDLAESLMKRDAELKDASTLMPGFGGVLDILDSLLLSAPVAYAFLTLQLL
ncbi:MAG: phosphatidate cytidylyltransferase [Planctomycetia bacterium]|nr:phosphatidate cytidylyltransferase [Planctomycetia bacterium]